MSVTAKPRPATGGPQRPARRFGPTSVLVLAAAITAGGILLVSTPDGGPPPPPGRVTSTAAWPDAQRATINGKLSDGSTFVPGHFLDARTAVGTAPGPDERSLRLVVRLVDGSSRELRSLPLDAGPAFGSFASSATELVWVESADGTPPAIWAADLRDARSPARRLTTDTGAAVFNGSQYDLVVNGGAVFWAAVPAGARTTEIRSVPLAGGAVTVRTEPGAWTLSEWPWLTDGSDQTSTARLRNPETGRDVEVNTGSGTELVTCGPAWCRVTVVGTGGINRIDLMRHDGSDRTAVADGTAGAVGTDVAILGRFELLFETRGGAEPDDRTALLVHDIAADRTVEVSPAVDGAFSRAGMLWWSTSDGDSLVWHTLDLRTV
jgi:hypothetical protein